MDAVYLEDIPRTIEFLLSIDQFIFDIDGGALGGREACTRPAHFDAAGSRSATAG